MLEQIGTVLVGGEGGVITGSILSSLELPPPPPQPDKTIRDIRKTLFIILFRYGTIQIKFLHETPDS